MHASCLQFLKRVLTKANVSGKRVLELGSYNVNGSPRSVVAPLSPATYHGIDMQAQTDFVDEVADVSQLDRKNDGQWDVVISAEMLEHCQDWRSAIESMKRACVPGGLLVVTARGPGKAYHGYPDDYWRFTVEDFRAIFADFDCEALSEDTGEPGVLFAGRKMDVPQVDLSSIEPAKAPPKPPLPGIQRKCQLVICTPMCIVPNGIPGGSRLEHLSPQWHRARQKLQIPYGYNATELICDGFEIGEARTMACRQALDAGADYMFFIDSDVLIPPQAFKQLMYRMTVTHPDHDVAAGVYCTKERPTIPIIYRQWGEGPCWDWNIGDVLTPVVGVPMGCTLIRLKALERMPTDLPWFKTHDLSEGNPFEPDDTTSISGTVTEDLWFTKLLVERAGGKILVDTAIQCGHQNRDTGEIFCLPEDSPPVVRAGIKPLEEAKA